MATNGKLGFRGFATDGSTSVRYVEVHVADGGIGAFLTRNIAGERNPDSPTNSYLVAKQEANPSRINATGTQIVASVPIHLYGFISNATTGGNISIFDASASGVTASAIFVQPTNVNFILPVGVRFESGLVVSNTVSAVANDVTFLWRPI